MTAATATAAGRDLLLRADCGNEVGLGHLTRIISIAEAWMAAGGRAVVAITGPADEVPPRVLPPHIEVVAIDAVAGSAVDAKATAAAGRTMDAPALLLDGYAFDAAYMGQAARWASQVALVDDGVRRDELTADMIIDPNMGANADAFVGRTGDARLLLGPRYAPIRRAFRSARAAANPIKGRGRRLLVSFGGGTVNTAMTDAVQALAESAVPDLEITVIGRDEPTAERLARAARNGDAEIFVEIAPEDPAALMSKQDAIVCPTSVTLLEAACIGIPTLTILTADNQAHAAHGWAGSGATRFLGALEDVTSDTWRHEAHRILTDRALRAGLNNTSVTMVDGRGADRIVENIVHTKPAVKGTP